MRLLISIGLALAVSATTALAGFPPYDAASGTLADASYPALSMPLGSVTPHIAYVASGTAYHAWRGTTSWQDEAIATGVVGGSSFVNNSIDLQFLPDGRPVALYRLADRLELSIRTAGVWTPEPVMLASNTQALSLAVSPVNGDVVAAWAWRAVSTDPFQVYFARRASGVWTTVLVDTTSASLTTTRVAVAVGPDDRPCLLYGRPRGDGLRSPLVLTFARGSGPNGPFVSEPVDSSLKFHAVLALDPASGDPRIAYVQPGASINAGTVVYAARTGAGAWEFTPVRTTNLRSTSPSLAIDAAGAPYVSFTEYTFIEPQQGPGDAGAGDDPAVFTETGLITLLTRASASGTAPFVFHDFFSNFDLSGGPRALATTVAGGVFAAFRTPGQNASPFKQQVSASAGLVGVAPDPSAPLGFAPVSPNPARLGGELQLAFSLARTSEVTLELHDVGGRLVATAAQGRLAPGPHRLVWAPTAPHAGAYWVTLRAGGARLASRRVVLLR